MTDRSPDGQSPIATWSKLIESTMKGIPAAQMPTEQTQEEDPWMALTRFLRIRK